MNNMTRLNLNVSLDLKCEIKKRAATRNISMRKYIIRALMQYLDKEKKFE